jgi:hypothetical protein
MAGIDPDLNRQLMTTLRRCDAFTSNAELRSVFVDGRLSPWAYNVPEGESPAGRVQATIAFLHDKANAQGQNALVLLLYVLQDRYDPNDAYYGELGALIARLNSSTPSSPLPSVSPNVSDPYAPYETAMHSLLSRLGKTHPRYNEALIYQQRLDENLKGTRLYGDTETRRAERAEILSRLNMLTMATFNTIFSELGNAPTPSATSSAQVGGITIIGDGNVIGNNNQASVNKPTTASRPPATTPSLPDRAHALRLLNLLIKHFSLDELNTLCFAVGVNYDELSGSGLTGKARELLSYCDRHSCLPALIDAGKTLRPELDWS